MEKELEKLRQQNKELSTQLAEKEKAYKDFESETKMAIAHYNELTLRLQSELADKEKVIEGLRTESQNRHELVMLKVEQLIKQDKIISELQSEIDSLRELPVKFASWISKYYTTTAFRDKWLSCVDNNMYTTSELLNSEEFKQYLKQGK